MPLIRKPLPGVLGRVTGLSEILILLSATGSVFAYWDGKSAFGKTHVPFEVQTGS